MRFIAAAIWVSLCFAQEVAAAPPPAPASCTASGAQLEANKKRVLEFFSFRGSLEEQANQFLTEDYIQHNPRVLRMDEITGAKGRAAWLLGFHEALRRGVRLAHVDGAKFDEPVVLMAECDLVTAIFVARREDPDRPGRHYEAFVFETFRIRDGKFSEHWDQEQLEQGWMGSNGEKGAKR